MAGNLRFMSIPQNALSSSGYSSLKFILTFKTIDWKMENLYLDPVICGMA